tara:strand:- start:2251 stop:2556 length:306 start_codon:yes stop_codon:yes gene_type:complete
MTNIVEFHISKLTEKEQAQLLSNMKEQGAEYDGVQYLDAYSLSDAIYTCIDVNRSKEGRHYWEEVIDGHWNDNKLYLPLLVTVVLFIIVLSIFIYVVLKPV